MINKSTSKGPSDPIKGLAERFKCPITHFIMEYPVMAADGFTYEQAAITAWFETRGARAISPATGQALAHHELVPNITLRNIIQEYLALQPMLRQKKLTEQDIQTAIRIRDEEIQNMLEKRERQVASAQAERDSIAQQLGPMEQENIRLRTGIQELQEQVVRSKSLLTNAVLAEGNRVDLPIDATLKQHLLNISQLEAETAEQKKHRAANIVKRAIGQRGIRRLIKSSRLQEAKEALLHKKAVGKGAYNKENAELQKQMERLVKQQNWKGVAQLTARAQAKEADFARQEQELDRQLADLFQAKEGKKREVVRRTNRSARITQQIFTQKQTMAHNVAEQARQAEDLTTHLRTRLPQGPAPKFFARQSIQPPVEPSQVAQLLKHIVRGEQDEAEAMLQKTPALTCATGNITDHAERTFTGITAFQYAVWTLDWHMWTMILNYLPQPAAREQCLVFQDSSAPWIQQHGKHFDLNPLIQALRTYVDNYSNWDDSRRRDYWCKTIGGLQRRLPAHVINEYCRPDRSFYPTPSFKEPTLPRRGYVDGKGKEYGLDWLLTATVDGGACGDGWAAWRGGSESGCRLNPSDITHRMSGWRALHEALVALGKYRQDGDALDRLYVTRTQQVEELFNSLNLTTKAGPVASL